MARRSGFPHRSRGSSGVARDWGVGPGGTGITTLTASGSLFLGSGATPTAQEITVMRTRGICDLFLSGVPATDGDGYFGAIGLGVVTNAAFAAGITAVPTPITEAVWNGWLWHSFFSVHWPETSLAPGSAAHQRIEIDSKAMRKFDTSQTLMAVIEVVEIGAAEINVFLDTRMLFQDSGR